jgi:multidrug transporter EmrE-like cation transporter
VTSQQTLTWLGLLALSVAGDVAATVYLKVAGDRINGLGFFWAAVIGVVVFAPSIVLFGYALQRGPSYIATVGVWAVGGYAANAVVGVVAFDDVFTARTALGVTLACATVMLLKPE